jgi:hypothetical protein
MRHGGRMHRRQTVHRHRKRVDGGNGEPRGQIMDSLTGVASGDVGSRVHAGRA